MNWLTTFFKKIKNKVQLIMAYNINAIVDPEEINLHLYEVGCMIPPDKHPAWLMSSRVGS